MSVADATMFAKGCCGVFFVFGFSVCFLAFNIAEYITDRIEKRKEKKHE